MPSADAIPYLAVLSQLIIISIISSYKWVQHQHHIFHRYPPTEYPKFYIYSLRTERLHIRVRGLLDVIGIIFVGCLFYFDYDHVVSLYLFWLLCTMIQLIPSFYSLLVLQVASSQRQKTIKRKTKGFSTVHRSIFDHFSMFYLFLLFVSVLLTLNIIISNEQQLLTKKIGLISLFSLTIFLLVRQIYLAIYGTAADKLIDENDRTTKRQLDVQRSFIGIAASVVIFSLFGLQGADRQPVWLIIPLSVFLQLAVFHRSKRWHAQDMNVYRAES